MRRGRWPDGGVGTAASSLLLSRLTKGVRLTAAECLDAPEQFIDVLFILRLALPNAQDRPSHVNELPLLQAISLNIGCELLMPEIRI